MQDAARIVSFTGRDRPGIVERLAAVVAEAGGNWEESRMARLGGCFVAMVKVSLPASRVAALGAAFEDLGALGLVRVTDVEGDEDAPAGRRMRLELTGADHPGIVRDVSRVLAAQRVNIAEMSTERLAAPMSGDQLFTAVAELTLPAGLSASALRRELEQLAADLVVDIALADPEESTPVDGRSGG